MHGVRIFSLGGAMLAATSLRCRPWDAQTPQTLAPPPPGLGRFAANSWSPDGRRLAGDIEFKDTGILLYTVATGTYERLTDYGQWPVSLPDSRRLLFVSSGDGFFVMDRVTKHVEKVFSVTRDVIGPPRLSRDGRRMYFSRRVTEADIWLVSLEQAPPRD